MLQLSCALLVDDDQTTNFLNQLLLKRLKISDNLAVALNGQEALSLVQEHCQHATAERPALVLLDVKMPVMDGFQFLEAYEQLTTLPKQAIMIVMLTTSMHPQDLERVQHLKISGFLNKPLTQEKIDHVLSTYANRNLAKNDFGAQA